MKKVVICFVLIAFLSIVVMQDCVQAQVQINTARSLGMGNAFIAVSDDEGAILANPAGLATARQGVMALGVLSGPQDYWYSTYFNAVTQSNLQATALYFAKSNNAAAGRNIDTFSWSGAQYYAADATIGVNLKYLRAKDTVAGTSGTSWGVDLGFLGTVVGQRGKPPTTKIGFLVQNVNTPRLLGTTQPRVISVGVSHRLIPNLLIAADFYNVLNVSGVTREGRVGAEFTPFGKLALRAGYLGQEKLLTLGAGVSSSDFHLDYGWAAKSGGTFTNYVGANFLF